jgi:hypothetical protein
VNYAVAGFVILNCKAKGAHAKILGVIAGHVGDHSRSATCWPSEKTIAELAGCTPRTVRRAIKELAEDGELSYVIHGGPPNREGERPNLYTVPERYQWDSVADKMSYEVKGLLESGNRESKMNKLETHDAYPDKMSATAETECWTCGQFHREGGVYCSNDCMNADLLPSWHKAQIKVKSHESGSDGAELLVQETVRERLTRLVTERQVA